jgi:alkylation response protein AidB-like acyl-CoA dehydrogenase
MDFRLTEEQLLLQKTIRDFAQKEVKPVAAELDKRPNPVDRFPWDLWKKAHAMGLLTLPLSPKWGGGGADRLTQLIVCEELGAGDGSFGKSVATHLQKAHFLERVLNEEQQKEFIPEFMDDDTYVISHAMTEPEHGSDTNLPYDEPGATLKTFAYLDGDEYVINGMKRFITQAAVAKLYYIWARTDKNLPISKSIRAFLVRAGTPGLTIGHIDDEMGGRMECRAEIIMENLRVPARYAIGEPDTMYGEHSASFLEDCLLVTTAGIGEARTCYEETREFARTRIQGGRPIIEHVNVGTRIADMLIGIEACRALVQKIAWAWDYQPGFDPRIVFLAKAFVAETLSKLYLDALEIWAGLGVQRDLPIERYFRNHFSTLHGAGTPVLNKIMAMKMF